ncbi:hypothetical protein BD410DRAFT_443657 [Rickenella mellea]|uniref:Serine-threonine/tyrosine-protein kinase catalytic domain-containing protein n=1 Tax=Rickenella mellea TaxID=50990 RepID=A0A4Y7PW32_9AGAM|nr:hypothetical protein BD410DRAFT_443657 [Rickenella mellea]
MYSFGCVCLEVFSRKPPYAELDDSGVKKAKLKHEPPKRPKSLHMDECLWDLTCKFFRFSPATRPTAAAASREIEHIIKWYNNLHTHPH